ncbi:helix-turn-helix transcriptional regulator [Natrinema salifodinae]|uniref:DUF7343 domain-containing protein n=1 Tax=Natrinema salifodinae TaxID=1202768 RepID=A0A1I0ND80_9EURY|nr:MarR family transcriptional regulator [Natrinema salifodinae]SEV99109.1 hypothetical protein SAMN05216285_1591 [Natrinema salifodinae]
MVPTSQIEVRTAFESIRRTVAVDIGPASSHYDEARVTAVEFVPRLGDHSGEPLSWLQLLRVSSSWEAALLAVLFLLISGLVGIRAAEVVSDRDVDLPTLPLIASAADQADESDGTRTDDPRGYEYYLSPDTPPELLSDEGKVVRLLVANHGRIRQHQIAEETGWSKSKVSRICSQMYADGTIEKQSVGRENVITLSERQSDETASDDESQSDDVENPLP